MKKTLVAMSVCATLAVSAASAHANPFASIFGRATGQEDDSAKTLREATAYAQQRPEWARPLMHALYRDGEWGAVLNLNRLGLAAMEKQQFGLASKAFDHAIARVEAIYADDANAGKARSVFNAEAVKDFKGEPYERAMLYYYRGLLYLQEGDYQNARAAFLAADRHDTLSSAEDKAFAGDFGMMKYLAGWASSCDGDSARAEQLIQEARAADKTIQALPERPASSMILVETGPAPVKWGDGQHKEILKFKVGVGDDGPISLRPSGRADVTTLQLVGDLTHQAMTRGGREVDGIMAGKAQFKDTAGAMGDTAFAVGAQLIQTASISGDRSTANAGLAGMFIGLIAKGVEGATTPAADVRAWNSLPSRVLIHLGRDVAKGPVTLVASGSAAAMPLQGNHGSCSFAWGRTRSALAAEAGASAGTSTEVNRGDRNRAFRSMLSTELAIAN